MRDSAPWKLVEARPPIAFALDGAPRSRGRRTSITTAEGCVVRVGEGQMRLAEADDVSLSYALPPSFDLRPLLGARVRVTLCDEPLASGPNGQLLTIADLAGVTKLVACFGPAHGNRHVVGGIALRAAMSQRPDGPIVFGTPALQCLVHVGDHVVVGQGETSIVMSFVARSAAGYASYVIADRSLWRAR